MRWRTAADSAQQLFCQGALPSSHGDPRRALCDWRNPEGDHRGRRLCEGDLRQHQRLPRRRTYGPADSEARKEDKEVALQRVPKVGDGLQVPGMSAQPVGASWADVDGEEPKASEELDVDDCDGQCRSGTDAADDLLADYVGEAE